MRRIVRILAPPAVAIVTLGCASAPAPAPPASPGEPVTPAALVASIADVAAGRNASMAEAGLVLKRVEFRLAVGTETRRGAKVEILLLDAGASQSAETAFLQEFTLEVPASAPKKAAPTPLVPGVREFVDAAMNTARDLARAAQAEGLPQRIRTVELTAKITRSKTAGGGISATIPAWVKPSAGADLSASREEENTVRLFFEAK